MSNRMESDGIWGCVGRGDPSRRCGACTNSTAAFFSLRKADGFEEWVLFFSQTALFPKKSRQHATAFVCKDSRDDFDLMIQPRIR